jgi:hypothetical protein
MKTIIIIVGLLIVAFFSSESYRTSASSDLKIVPGNVDTNCFAEPAWFLDSHIPRNQEPDSGKECQFYQWAWETFLYITRPEKKGGSPRFLNFVTPTELFGNDATPLFKNRADNALTLAPRVEESKIVSPLEDVLQANSKGILIDQNGHVVYYAQHVNAVFAKFVKQRHLNNMDTLLAFDPQKEFPSGSLELKSSWKIVNKGEDASKFYTTKAWVSKFVLKNGKIQIDPTQTRQETVALLGIHVVGVVDNHPEFIWATFEHDDLAPNLNGKDISSADPLDADPTHRFLLYATGKPINQSNKKPGNSLAFQDITNQTFKPITSVYHQFSEGDEDELVKPLNRTVKEKLNAMGSVWQYYRFKGAVWLNDHRKFLVGRVFSADDVIDNTVIGGEKNISNVTMETFTQNSETCFSCHKTSDETSQGLTFPGKKIGVSHVITNAWFNSKMTMIQKAKKAKK